MQKALILIVSSPGANQDSLHAVLPALFDTIALIDAVNYSQTLLLANENRPDIVLINTEIGFEESKRIYETLLSQFEDMKIVILAEGLHWQDWRSVRQPCQVLLKGFSTRELKAVIQGLLDQNYRSQIQSRNIEMRPR